MTMDQVRLYIRAERGQAERHYETLEQVLEDEALPIAISEVDEAQRLHEVSLYVAGDEVELRCRQIEAALGLPPGVIETEPLPDRDWMADVLKELAPVRAGRFLVHGAHDRHRVMPNDLAIEIEAGMAFGTGHHGTTAGCLEMLEALGRARRPRRALDVGTGSAVLAIAIARLSQARVVATDIDPVAVEVARANAAANGVGGRIHVVEASDLGVRAVREGGPYDLIVANILAGPLMALAPQFRRALSFSGDLVLSGILSAQRQKVLAKFRALGLVHRGTIWQEGWVTLHLSR